MATGILVGLTVVLVAAACYVGLLLLRRVRPAAHVEAPKTVGDLVRLRTAPPDEMSGTDLFTPKAAQAPEAKPQPPDEPSRRVPQPTPRLAATPPGGVEVGDAPWRRAARMMGSEPGGAWETAPVPVVPTAEPGETGEATERVGAGRTSPTAVPAGATSADTVSTGALSTGAVSTGAVPTGAVPAGAVRAGAVSGAPQRDEVGRAAVVAMPTPGREPDEAGPTDVDAAPPVVAVPEQADAEPTDRAAAPSIGASPVDPPVDVPSVGAHRVGTPPVAAPPVAAPPVAAPPVAAPPVAAPSVDSGHDDHADAREDPADAPDERVDAPSHPLSDPDLTPLMGIPVVRPLADAPAPAAPDLEPAPLPVAFRPRTSTSDDEVVFLLPATNAPPRAAVTGSPQPVWFRVVRRDGESVGGVLVALLDDHGAEVDATKTATDGGGELHAPHAGWFLMIASADGFQPRAVTLAVDEQPVEIALLLPRSATVAGVVRAGGAPAAGTRVVAFQEGEVVDDVVTDREGGYRFDDLAEGVYALSATGARGSAVARLTLTEGADRTFDLDLVPPDGAR